MSAASSRVAQWSAEEVRQWVDEQRLAAEYGAGFLQHRVDGMALLELDKSDLVDIGVRLVGHQKTLLRAIRALANQQRKSGS